MPSLKRINIAPALTFDALVAGEPGAPLVLLLHGFAESMQCWRAQVTALADMGYRAIAPSQRGYSKGARPDPRDPSRYHMDRLMDDAMAMAKRLADSAPIAIRFNKRLVNKELEMRVSQLYDLSVALEAITFETADHREAVKAFLDKRAPVFRNRE